MFSRRLSSEDRKRAPTFTLCNAIPAAKAAMENNERGNIVFVNRI